MSYAIFDTHCAVQSSDLQRYPRLTGSEPVPDDAGVATLLAAMDAAGVAKAVVVQLASVYGYDNRCLLDAVAQAPDRLVAVATIDMTAEDAPAVIASLAARGLAGLRIHTGKAGVRLDDPAGYAAWAAAGNAGLPVAIQTGPEGLAEVAALARRFAQVTILLDNIARIPLGDAQERINLEGYLGLLAHPNLFFKLSPRTLADARQSRQPVAELLAQLVYRLGAERIAFSSNYPSKGSLAETVCAVQAALSALDVAARERILQGTAAAIYPALAQ